MASDSSSSIASHRGHRDRTLDGVTQAASQSEGIGLVDVDAFATLVVRADNSVYQITILKPHAREGVGPGRQILPSADPRLPERVDVPAGAA